MIPARGEAKEDLVYISTFSQYSNVLWDCRKRNPKHKTSKLLLPPLPKMHCVNAATLAKKSCFGVLFSS